MDEIEANAGTTAGAQLRAAREAAGLSIADIAAKTRITQRHLEAIERDDFNALPSTTYAVGFARAFARAAGAEEVAIAASVRAQLDHGVRERHDYHAFEPADPARVPPRALAWTAAIVALLILGGYAFWRASSGDGTEPPPAVTAEQPGRTAPQPGAGPAPAPAPAAGPVVLTATDRVWLRISDASGQRLFEKEMATGETYTVPDDANGPTITTGRPNALRITVGGTEVPPVGEPETLVKGIGVSSNALRARTSASPAATPTPAAPPR